MVEALKTEEEIIRICTFLIEGKTYGVDIKEIQEVSNEIVLTPIKHAHVAVEGYANMRGEIYLVANLRTILGFKKNENNTENRIFYLKNHAGENFGFIVDKVGDVIDVENSQFENKGNMNSVKEENSSELRQGVCYVGNKIITVLKAKAILENINF